MRFLRSLLFNVLFFAWTAGASIVCLPALILPRSVVVRLHRLWARGVLWLLRWTVGLRYQVRGLENLPSQPALFAFKHQSAWETIVFALLVPDFAAVLKRELLMIPFFGWYVWKLGMIPIDRGAAGKALRRMVRRARERLAEGRPVMVAPEGTRTAPGQHRPYLPGVAALYSQLAVPVVPVALNSGLFWGRRAFVKHPGVITVAFLEPIAPGLDRRVFLAELQRRIETASERLAREAARPTAWKGAARPPAR